MAFYLVLAMTLNRPFEKPYPNHRRTHGPQTYVRPWLIVLVNLFIYLMSMLD